MIILKKTALILDGKYKSQNIKFFQLNLSGKPYEFHQHLTGRSQLNKFKKRMYQNRVKMLPSNNEMFWN